MKTLASYWYTTPTEESVEVFCDERLEPESITGPFCSRARTLPATTRIQRKEQVFSARIPDPVFWSPEFPAWYRLNSKDKSYLIGIRKLECARRSFYQNGRRRVIRAADLSYRQISIDDIDLLKSEQLEGVVSEPSLAVLQHASEVGVLLIVKPSGTHISEEIVLWPCVGMLIMDERNDVHRGHTPNHILLHPIRDPADLDCLPTWPHGFMAQFELFHDVSEAVHHIHAPILAVRKTTTRPDRSRCDSLQSDLAPEFSLAGYVA